MLRSLGRGKGGRLVLSLYFKAVLGIQRLFHFETLDDLGFAFLSGGKRVIGRSHLGTLIRKVPIRGLKRFINATTPRIKRADSQLYSIDEHAIARFTRKFAIAKGFHTIRNKAMKIEKITFAFHLASRQLIGLVVSNGKAKLTSLTKQLLPSLRRRNRGAALRLILDAGAAQNYEELLKTALRDNQVTLVRTPRRKPYTDAWKKLPNTDWTEFEEPGPYKDAPSKKLALAETTTLVQSNDRKLCCQVRTIVVCETASKGKQRWHGLWVFGDTYTPAYDLVKEFRTRQHHEQTYRVMLHDIYVDTAPSGYNKRSRNPKRPGFRQNALTLYSWVAALATNTLLTFTELLPEQFTRAHPRTLRRWFFRTTAELYLGDGTLIVSLQPKRLLHVWAELVASFNRRHIRLPWFDNRRVIMSLDASSAQDRNGNLI